MHLAPRLAFLPSGFRMLLGPDDGALRRVGFPAVQGVQVAIPVHVYVGMGVTARRTRLSRAAMGGSNPSFHLAFARQKPIMKRTSVHVNAEAH